MAECNECIWGTQCNQRKPCSYYSIGHYEKKIKQTLLFNSNHINAEELKRKLIPKKSDIKETKQLLQDFNIHIEIPYFLSLYQLYQWRHDVILKRYDNY